MIASRLAIAAEQISVELHCAGHFGGNRNFKAGVAVDHFNVTRNDGLVVLEDVDVYRCHAGAARRSGL